MAIDLPALMLSLMSVIADCTEVTLAVTIFPALFFILANETRSVTATFQFKYVRLLSVCCGQDTISVNHQKFMGLQQQQQQQQLCSSHHLVYLTCTN